MQLFLLQNGASKDITARSGDYTRSDNIDGLGMSFTFTLASNPDDKHLPDLNITPGDKIIFANKDKKVFTGIITDCGQDGLYSHGYTAYDYGWYLNKNEVVAQFNNMPADQAITKLCNQFTIPIGTIAPMPTMIKTIYNGAVLSDCIKDIIEQTTQDTGQKYRLEVRDNQLYIEPYTDLIVTAMYKPADNVAAFDVAEYPADISMSMSITDMSNTVQVVSSAEKSVMTMATAKDNESIKRYGMLQKVETVDKKDKAKAGNIAKNILSNKNKVTKSLSILFLGDDNVRSGRLINFKNAALGVDGLFLVRDCTHNYTQAGHTMQLTMEEV